MEKAECISSLMQGIMVSKNSVNFERTLMFYNTLPSLRSNCVCPLVYLDNPKATNDLLIKELDRRHPHSR